MPKSKSTKKRITVKSEKKDVPPSTKKEAASSMSSDEDDWEEVEEDKINQSNIAVKDVEIEFDLPGVVQKQRKKNSAKDWILAFVKRCMNKNIKDRQISLHKVHLVCLLSVGFQLNEVGSSEDLQALILSTLPEKFIDPQPKLMTIERLTNILNWITSKFTKGNNAVTLKNQGTVNIGEKEKCIEKCIEIGSVQQKLDLVLLCLVLFRALGLQVRFVFSVHPISFKPPKYEEVEKNALKLANHLEKLKKVTANQCENLEELLCKVRLVNFTPEEIKEESIPQVDGACDDETTQPRRSTRKRTKVLAEAKTNKNSSSRTKRQKPNEKSSSETEVVSKYEFKDSSLTKEAKNTNSNNSKEVSKHFKSKVGNKSKLQRNISPSKKLSIMVSNDKPVFEDNKPCADQQNHISDDQDAVTRKRKNDEEQEKENKVKRTLRKTTVKIKSCPEDSGHLSEENNDFETTVTKKRKTRSNKTKPKTQKVQKQDVVLSDEEDDFLPDQKPDSDDDEDSDFEAVEHKKAKPSTSRPSQLKKPPTKKPVKKASGTKSKSNNQNSEKDINEWLEVYIAKVGWVTVDCVAGVINEPDAIESKTTNPIQYVLSFDGNNSVKDVTSRYASQWLIMTRKLRIGYLEKDWWNNLLACYKTKNKAQDLEENKQLEAKLLSQPLPTSIAAFKSHPLFALRRHLLKYEAVYPPDVPPLGYVKSEEVLPRSSVHCLHTKEKWLQSALTVRDGEQPYKMVASYLLNKKLQRNSDTPSLALFGEWQCDPYQPPVAEGGKVPRNDFGNVDLYQPSMLPIGCVHLRLPNLQVVAKKLNIDIASAVVGFDTHHGFPHPTLDGYVVCKEFEEVLTDAWEEEETLAAERAFAKREERVLKNWKLLFRGVLTLERLRNKYKDVEPIDSTPNEQQTSADEKTPATTSSAWQTERLQNEKEKQKPKRKTRAAKKKTNKNNFPYEVETI